VLSWGPPGSGTAPTTYILEAGSSSGASNVIVYPTGSAVTSYTATGVGAATYFVRVRAANAQGTSAPSNEIAFTVGSGGPSAPSGPAGPPLGLVASASGSSVTLSWSAPALGGSPTYYVVQAGSGPGLSDLANFSTGKTLPSLSASGVGAGTYFVRVRAGNESGVSAASNEVVLVVGGGGPGPCAGPPGAPSGLQSNVSGSTVTLTWSAASAGPTSYVVEAGSSSGRSDLVANDTGNTGTSLTATGVGAGTYFVRMRARNACGNGAPSNEVTVVVR
jgi:predicted phage tail protein